MPAKRTWEKPQWNSVVIIFLFEFLSALILPISNSLANLCVTYTYFSWLSETVLVISAALCCVVQVILFSGIGMKAERSAGTCPVRATFTNILFIYIRFQCLRCFDTVGWGQAPVWARGHCRISPSRFLVECCKRQLFCCILGCLVFWPILCRVGR